MMMEAPLFMDDSTAESLEWSTIWSKLRPVSPYGKWKKQHATPYLPGQEDDWRADLTQLKTDLDAWSVEAVHRLRQRLSDLPDVIEIVTGLSERVAPLSKKELLFLKHVAFVGFQLVHDEALNGWSHPGRWQSCLQSFGQVDTRGFATEHVAGGTYRTAMLQAAEYQGALARATRARDEEILNQFGVRPNRDGILTLSLPAGEPVVNQLKSYSGVTWVRDTPFESVFEASPTTSMVEAAAQISTCQQALNQMEQAALQALTEKIRSHVKTWVMLCTDLASLDWRLARIVLAHEWQGVVPQSSQTTCLTNAVHPLVNERLAKRDRNYVPLVLQPEFGVNVICGTNMGGKTVSMVLYCICQALAQYALPVPAECFQTCLFGVVRFCATADTDTDTGLSSFGNEMVRFTKVWEDISDLQSALICVDEPGRTTNPTEGEALVIGIVHALQKSLSTRRCVILLATHFSAPIRENGVTVFRVRGLHEDTLERLQDAERIPTERRLQALEDAMDYRLERVDDGQRPTEALRIAKWLGVPEEVLRESEAFLGRGKLL